MFKKILKVLSNFSVESVFCNEYVSVENTTE